MPTGPEGKKRPADVIGNAGGSLTTEKRPPGGPWRSLPFGVDAHGWEREIILVREQ